MNEETQEVQTLSLFELNIKIREAKDKKYSLDKTLKYLSDEWQYGRLKLPAVKTLAHLRQIVAGVYNPLT
jgi:hypothetical protein